MSNSNQVSQAVNQAVTSVEEFKFGVVDMFKSVLVANKEAIVKVAASVGIDWEDMEDYVTFPNEYSQDVSVLDTDYQGKVGIKTYINFTDEGVPFPAITFRTFKHGGITKTWMCKDEASSVVLTKEETEQLKADIEAQRLAKEVALREKTLFKRSVSLAEYNLLPVATYSDYLIKKDLAKHTHLVKRNEHEGYIAHPLFDETGATVGFERIYDDGSKKVSAGAGTINAYFGGVQGTTETVYITEGFADALTISDATNATVICAISAGNVKKVYHIATKLFPESKIVIAIDNDDAGDASVNFEGDFTVVKPNIYKDFNDVLVNCDLDMVKLQLKNVVTSNTVEHNKYFTQQIKKGMVNVLIGEKGTGKTHTVKTFLQSEPESKVLACTHRRTLNRQIANECSLYNYEDIRDEMGVDCLQLMDKLVISPESIRYLDYSATYNTVFIDEVEQVLQHLCMSSTLHREGQDGTKVEFNKTACDMLLGYCHRATTVILADANAGNLTRQFIDCFKGKNVQTLVNTYKPRKEQQAKITIYKTQAEVFGLAANDSRKAYCCSDTKASAETFHAARANHNSILVTSETDNEGFLTNVNMEVHNYSTVCASPSMSTGVSIDVGHGYEVGYAIFDNGFQTAEQCLQQLARMRELGEYHIYISPKTCLDMTTAKEVQEVMIKEPTILTSGMFNLTLDGELLLDNFGMIYSEAKASCNKSKVNRKALFKELAKEEGFTVVERASKNKALADDGKQATQQHLDDKALAEELELAARSAELATEFSLTQAEADTLAKREKSHSVTTKGADLLRKVIAPKSDAALADQAELDLVVKGRKSTARLSHNVLTRELVKKVLKVAGVNLKTGTITKTWTTSCPQLDQFVASNLKDIYRHIGVTLTAKSMNCPTRFYNNLLRKLGLDIELVVKTNSTNTYQVTQESLDLMLKVL